ncbi:MAG: phytanoyl-CoA dioxygenase family protein [Planctomycetota bacterium]|nr:phytanoyl-CoA dioxygenase family protein [Planctomycetota bacterium]
MTPEEKFTVDLEGYLVIKNVLSADEVAEMNAISEEKFPPPEDYEGGRRSVSRVSLWGPKFQALVDHPRIVPYLVELLGPKFRLDHDYCIFMRKTDDPKLRQAGSLHGGEVDHAGDHWYKYRDGVIRNGLSMFTFCLSDSKAGDGGFACIPGSHKSNFYACIPSEVRRFERRPHYVVQPEADAGDVIFFTEALIHGTLPWTADHERRAFLFKYSPGHSAWSQSYYDLDEFENLTEQQKRILAPPSVGRRPNSVEAPTDV